MPFVPFVPFGSLEVLKSVVLRIMRIILSLGNEMLKVFATVVARFFRSIKICYFTPRASHCPPRLLCVCAACACGACAVARRVRATARRARATVRRARVFACYCRFSVCNIYAEDTSF